MNKIITTLFLLGCSFFIGNYNVLAVIPNDEIKMKYDYQCTVTIDANKHDYSVGKFAVANEPSCKNLVKGYFITDDGNFNLSGAASSIVHYDGEQFLGETDRNRTVLVTVNLIEPQEAVKLTSIREDFKKRYENNHPDVIDDEDFLSVSEVANTNESKKALNNLEQTLNQEPDKVEKSKKADEKKSADTSQEKTSVIAIIVGVLLIGVLLVFFCLRIFKKKKNQKKHW